MMKIKATKGPGVGITILVLLAIRLRGAAGDLSNSNLRVDGLSGSNATGNASQMPCFFGDNADIYRTSMTCTPSETIHFDARDVCINSIPKTQKNSAFEHRWVQSLFNSCPSHESTSNVGENAAVADVLGHSLLSVHGSFVQGPFDFQDEPIEPNELGFLSRPLVLSKELVQQRRHGPNQSAAENLPHQSTVGENVLFLTLMLVVYVVFKGLIQPPRTYFDNDDDMENDETLPMRGGKPPLSPMFRKELSSCKETKASDPSRVLQLEPTSLLANFDRVGTDVAPVAVTANIFVQLPVDDDGGDSKLHGEDLLLPSDDDLTYSSDDEPTMKRPDAYFSPPSTDDEEEEDDRGSESVFFLRRSPQQTSFASVEQVVFRRVDDCGYHAGDEDCGMDDDDDESFAGADDGK